jgi:hypothetical protein
MIMYWNGTVEFRKEYLTEAHYRVPLLSSYLFCSKPYHFTNTIFKVFSYTVISMVFPACSGR